MEKRFHRFWPTIKERDHLLESVQYLGGKGSRGGLFIPYPVVCDISVYLTYYIASTELRFLTVQLQGNYYFPLGGKLNSP